MARRPALRLPALRLNAMTVSELLQLRDEVQTALSGKIQMERHELQRKIDELSALENSAAGATVDEPQSTRIEKRPGRRRAGNRRSGSNGKGHPLKGRTVAPKYRDPENPDQTWAGRGQAPRWLTAYESQGRKRDEFLIGPTAESRAKGRKGR